MEDTGRDRSNMLFMRDFFQDDGQVVLKLNCLLMNKVCDNYMSSSEN